MNEKKGGRLLEHLPEILAALPARLLPVCDLSLDLDTGEVLPISSAVLILLYPHTEGIHLLLTVRQATLRRHAGQISLPGGRREPNDDSLWATAVRETEEELGVSRDGPVALGRLDTHHLFVSGHSIAPYVAWMPDRPVLRPDSREVAEVIEVPLDVLLDRRSVVEDIWRLRDADWKVVYYRFGEHRIWGATARILHDLVTRIRQPVSGEPEPGSVTAIG